MARLDMEWHAHPRLVKLGLTAMGLHAWSISYSDFHRTDGFIPAGAWPASFRGVSQAIRALKEAGFWESVPRGFQVHDYLEYNASRAQIEEIVAVKRAAGQAGGQASAQAKRQARASPPATANGSASATAPAQAKPKQVLKQPLKQNSTPRSPVPGLTPKLPEGRLVGSGVASAREALPDEVIARLNQPPIATRPADQPA